MGRTGPRLKPYRIWSGLSESNRHLNLGKVRVVKSNALERRHLAFWGRVLIGKRWKTKARSSLYCQNRCSRGLVRVFSERQHITRRAFPLAIYPDRAELKREYPELVSIF